MCRRFPHQTFWPLLLTLLPLSSIALPNMLTPNSVVVFLVSYHRVLSHVVAAAPLPGPSQTAQDENENDDCTVISHARFLLLLSGCGVAVGLARVGGVVLVLDVVVREDGGDDVVVWKVVSMDVRAVPVDVGVSVCAVLSTVLEDASVVVGLVVGEAVVSSVFEVSFVVVIVSADVLLSVEVGEVFADVDPSVEDSSGALEVGFSTVVCSVAELVVALRSR